MRIAESLTCRIGTTPAEARTTQNYNVVFLSRLACQVSSTQLCNRSFYVVDWTTTAADVQNEKLRSKRVQSYCFVVKYTDIGALNKKNKLASKFTELSILTTPPVLRIGSLLESFFWCSYGKVLCSKGQIITFGSLRCCDLDVRTDLAHSDAQSCARLRCSGYVDICSLP